MLELLLMGLNESALLVAVMFDAHLRPSEALEMKTFQVVPPTRGLWGRFEFWTLLVRHQGWGDS